MAQSISFEQAVALAQSGDAEAQYAVSSVLHRRGRFEESLHWLRRAAEAGHPAARITFATFFIDGRRCPRDRDQAMRLLEPLTATHIEANLLLAELHGFAALGGGDRERGLRHLATAARLGDAGALRQLALLGACHGRDDLVPALLVGAARGGDSAANRALQPDSAYAEGHLEARPAATAQTELDWTRIQDSLPQLASDIALPAAQVLSETPSIRRIPGAIPALVRDYLIGLAAPLVTRSQIVDAATGEARADPMRTSSHVTLGPRQHDHVIESLEGTIGRIADSSALNGEFVQILRYRPGEEFLPHVDYFNESGAGAYLSLADGGQRAQTVLLYLNDGYTGGSTRFPALGLDVKGGAGDLLHFHNVDRDGRGHRDTLHAGTPVVAGEKWLLSKWIRRDAYPPRLAW